MNSFFPRQASSVICTIRPGNAVIQKKPWDVQALWLHTPRRSKLRVPSRREIHFTKTTLLQQDVQGKGQSAASVRSKTNPPTTGEEVEQFEQGTHQWLQQPAKKIVRSSLLVDLYKAPNFGFIKVITLNELRTFNALSQQMVSELAQEVEQIHAEESPGETRVLIIRSEAEKAFCAGANLKERAAMTVNEYVKSGLKLTQNYFHQLLTVVEQMNSSLTCATHFTGSQLFQSRVLRLFMVWRSVEDLN